MTKKRNQALIMLLPFLILVTIFYLSPAILTVTMAFTDLDASFVWNFSGLDNFKKIFMDPNTIPIVFNSLLFVFCTIILTILIDILLAVLTTHFIKNDKISTLFKALLMIPMITPSVVYSVLWVWLLAADENGLGNKILNALTGHDAINWMVEYPFAIIILAQLMLSLAFGTTIFSSAIKSIPDNQIQAARVDGENEWGIILSVIIPNIKGHIQFLAIWEILGLLTNYITILLITNGGPGIKTEVWALSAYHKAFIDQQYGYGAAISLVLIIVVVLLMIGLQRHNHKKPIQF